MTTPTRPGTGLSGTRGIGRLFTDPPAPALPGPQPSPEGWEPGLSTSTPRLPALTWR